MPKPLIAYDPVHTLSNAAVLPKEPFAVAGVEYLALQPSAWEGSAESWDEDDRGGWRGPGALHSGPGQLWLSGATVAPRDYDDIARLANGSTLVANWQMIQQGWIAPSGTLRFLLQDVASGDILLSVTAGIGATSLDLGALLDSDLADGSYTLWGRVESALAEWQLPPDYYDMTGYTDLSAVPQKYKFIENNELRVWDWLRDVGVRPTNTSQLALDGTDMYAAYSEAEANHELQRRGEWTRYIASGAAQGGPWSALRFVIGSGDWEAAAGVLPAIGASLLALDDENTSTPVAFDVMASSVSAWAKMKLGDAAGEHRLGGTVATRNGPSVAYWHFHPEESTPATLLGTSDRTFVAVCEASLYPTVSDILEQSLPEGSRRELVLTYGHLKEYAPKKSELNERLPGLPRATLGHPGGRCLRQVGDTVLFLTENFLSSPPGEINFYNRIQEQRAGLRASGPGTAFHSDNAGESVWGAFYGVRQDKPFGDETARQFIGYIENRQWITSGMESFPAAAYRWQRLRALAHPDGLLLYVTGKDAASENAIWGIADGREFREGALNFRARRITRVEDEDGHEQLYALGRFVENGEVSQDWSVIKLPGDGPNSGGFRKICFFWNDDDQRFIVPRASAEAVGLDPAKLKPYLWWVADALRDAGGYWQQQAATPDDGRAYLELTVTADAIEYSPGDGVTMPYDPNHWERICFIVMDDGSGGGPYIDTFCDNALCVYNKLPGAKVLYENKVVENGPWYGIAINDMNDMDATSRLRKLANLLRFYPISWMQPPDSDADEDDLASYTVRVPFNRFVSLPREANVRLRWVGIIPADAGEILAPSIDRRN